jgi:hypothetical protein
MTKVFIGGSRHISRLNLQVRERLDKIVAKGLPVLIGDANGADKAVQQYLHDKHYANVEVFCAGRLCRNNIGKWKLRTVPTPAREKTFDFFAAKDRLMAHEAGVGLMIWDGKSAGTLLNVLRLLRQRKKVVVYAVPEGRFWELKHQSQWQDFVAACDVDLRNRVEQKAAFEKSEEYPEQQSLLTLALSDKGAS